MCCVFPMLAACAWAAEPAGNEAIRKAIATFNNPRERGVWRISVTRIAGAAPLLAP